MTVCPAWRLSILRLIEASGNDPEVNPAGQRVRAWREEFSWAKKDSPVNGTAATVFRSMSRVRARAAG
jgi:hypothetical protein